MKLPLAYPFPLRQFLEPGKVLARVFDTAQSFITEELQDEFHLFQ